MAIMHIQSQIVPNMVWVEDTLNILEKMSVRGRHKSDANKGLTHPWFDGESNFIQLLLHESHRDIMNTM